MKPWLLIIRMIFANRQAGRKKTEHKNDKQWAGCEKNSAATRPAAFGETLTIQMVRPTFAPHLITALPRGYHGTELV
ncbi:hypothetical protein LJC22_03195 [Desulfosarcina sp. OttesenSCG-928-G10]|nr:hypothetical protein [Desulfosarcina sp. OttesenSCG-928-G10]